MTRQRKKEQQQPDPRIASPFESGVISKDPSDQPAPEGAPPWPIVHAYLETGAHRLWVEGWAARSPAFADVLAALRNDHEDRAQPDPDDVLIPLDRRR